MHPSLEAGATIDVLPDVACWACLRHLIEINIVCTCPLGCLRFFFLCCDAVGLELHFLFVAFLEELVDCCYFIPASDFVRN